MQAFKFEGVPDRPAIDVGNIKDISAALVLDALDQFLRDQRVQANPGPGCLYRQRPV